jgi:Flp pilus assembly protein TadG
MTQSRHTSTWRPKGQIIAVLAIALPSLLGAMALVTDVGLLYYNWGLLQKAADSAALAGASYLPQNAPLAVSTAQNYASFNGIALNEIAAISISPDETSLTIQLSRSVPYNFATLLGLFSGNVGAAATAQIQTIGSAIGITPVGIDYRTLYTSGQIVTLMEGQVGPGNWDALALGGSGASNYEQNVEYGYQGQVSVGDMVSTEPGKMTGPTKTGFNYLINQGQSSDPSGTFAVHTLTDPRILIVPMVDFSGINGKSQVPVKGFAALWLVGVDSQNNISTYFINEVAPGSTPDPNAPNYGAYKAVLIQ